MKKYLKSYQQEVEQRLQLNKKVTAEELEYHKTKIMFFQHERLVHLLVTITFAFLLLFSVYFSNSNLYFLAISALCFILLVCYIGYYFYLENTVQLLYRQYDQLMKKGQK